MVELRIGRRGGDDPGDIRCGLGHDEGREGPEADKDDQGGLRGPGDRRDPQRQEQERHRVEQVEQHQQQPAPVDHGAVVRQAEGEDRPAHRRGRHDDDADGRRDAEELAPEQVAIGNAQAERLAQGAAVPLTREGGKGQQDDDQRQQDLQGHRRRHVTEAGDGAVVLGRAILGEVGLVRFEPDCRAGIVADAAVEEGQRSLGLVGVVAEVRRGVRVLAVLVEPLLGVLGLGRLADLAQGLVALVSGQEGREQQQDHDQDRPFEPAVAEQAEEFLLCDHPDHGKPFQYFISSR